MTVYLDYTNTGRIRGEIHIPGSKSLSNRWLILSRLFPGCIDMKGLSPSDDTKILDRALESDTGEKHLGMSGTAMRFLIAYFSAKPGANVVLRGEENLLNRPIGSLVNTLRKMGAQIDYLEKEGFPPVRITGNAFPGGKYEIDGSTSSQFVSALLLISPLFAGGLQLRIKNHIVSEPYIDMTVSVLKQAGIWVSKEGSYISVRPVGKIKALSLTIEPDWSALSYYYSLAALHSGVKLYFPGFEKESLQGDSVLPVLFEPLGVHTAYTGDGIRLTHEKKALPGHMQYDLNAYPDLAQSLAVACTGLGIKTGIVGLTTLKIKETDRLNALKKELQKTGAGVRITEHSIHISPPEKIRGNLRIKTYGDHRMAMAFAPLSVKIPLWIENAEVVSKSYPGFWEDWEKLLQEGE